MAFASKSAVSAQKRQIPSKASAVGDLNPGVIPLSLIALGLPNRDRPSGQTVPILASSRSAPSWLLRLCALQRRSCVVTFLLVATLVTIYGSTAYSQQRWSQEYRKLVNLQSDERHLTTTNEVLKNQMALQAEQPATELVPLNPAAAIFLPSAPQRPDRAATKATAQTKQLTPIPLGY